MERRWSWCGGMTGVMGDRLCGAGQVKDGVVAMTRAVGRALSATFTAQRRWKLSSEVNGGGDLSDNVDAGCDAAIEAWSQRTCLQGSGMWQPLGEMTARPFGIFSFAPIGRSGELRTIQRGSARLDMHSQSASLVNVLHNCS